MASLLLLLCLVPHCWSYCSFRDPWWSGPAVVEQVSLTSVRVSWFALLHNGHCADDLIVKYYQGYNVDDYTLSEYLPPNVTAYIVDSLAPNTEYRFQVIAREDKGFLGVNWHRGDTTAFATSRTIREQGLEVKEDDPVRKVNTQFGIRIQNLTQQHRRKNERVVILGMGLEVFVVIIVLSLVTVTVILGVLVNWCKRPQDNIVLDLGGSKQDVTQH